MDNGISESTVSEMREGSAEYIAHAIRNLPEKEREVFIRALGSDGILDRAALGATCGPAAHDY